VRSVNKVSKAVRSSINRQDKKIRKNKTLLQVCEGFLSLQENVVDASVPQK
jgi:hypothetical protein